jgi:hypothetical protein
MKLLIFLFVICFAVALSLLSTGQLNWDNAAPMLSIFGITGVVLGLLKLLGVPLDR